MSLARALFCVLLVTIAIYPTNSVVVQAQGAIYSVTNANDDGLGSLRAAIGDANTNPGLDTIVFAIPGTGVQRIEVLTLLPVVTDPVVIDGTTQPGYAGTPLIEVNGRLRGTIGFGAGAGLEITAGGSTVRGLAVTGFEGIGIWLRTRGNNRIEGNYIGDVAGTFAALGRRNWVGVYVERSAANVIGGTAVGARNVISGNLQAGVDIDTNGNNTVVQGNYIGVDPTGMVGASSGRGVHIRPFVTGAVVRGNVISGNSFSGVDIWGAQTVVQGNVIGLNAAGTAVLGNGRDDSFATNRGGGGIHVTSSSSFSSHDTTIGGVLPGEGNVIAGNLPCGISFRFAGVATIQGNWIGTRGDATTAAPNGGGICLENSSSVVMGGVTAGAANVIAHNRDEGVWIKSGTNNAIRGNRIYGNGLLGIDLNGDGVTPNDALDADTGANNLQNFPILAAAVSNGGQTAIDGSLASSANATYDLDFFANSTCGGSGHGEGQTYLGSATVTTGAGGTATFRETFAGDFPTGLHITATASVRTTSSSHTSEFSACVTLVNTNDQTPPVIDATVTPSPNAAGWNNATPTVTWSVEDAESGITASNGCETTTVTSDTSGLMFTCAATNGAGMSASASVTVKLDTVPPIIMSSRSLGANANGWNNTDVIVSFDCADTGSGIAGCTSPQTLSTDGADQSVTGMARDAAGNEATVLVGPISIDKTAPAITANRTPPNGSGWNNTDVTVDFTCTDVRSGVAAHPTDLTLGAERANQSAAATCVDRAGNIASVTVENINIDKTAPAVMGARVNAPNSRGWNNEPVVVRFEATDALSGVRGSASEERRVEGEGPDQSVRVEFSDLAGNVGSATVDNIDIDLTPPVLTAARSPLPNVNNWHNTDVTVDFTCIDTLSGVVAQPPDPTLTGEGANQSATASCQDVADNAIENTESGIHIDKTAPLTAATPSRPPDMNGWYNHAFDVSWSAGDALSGVETCRAPLTYPGPDTAAAEVVGSCEDHAGNVGHAPFGFLFDATAPTIEIAQPADGVSFVLNQTVLASYSCVDATSGVGTCVGPVESGAPFDTTTVAGHTFTVNTADVAGNRASLIHRYTVKYAFSGFFAPLVNPPTINRGPAGRTFPVKFTLQDATGGFISDPASIAGVTLVPGACGALATDVEGGETAVDLGGLRHDPLTGVWHFNWQTAKPQLGCWTLEVRLADGSVHPIGFELR